MDEENENINLSKDEVGEDATMYGEFVCSAFRWLPLQEQKRNAKHLENVTNENIKKKLD